MKLINKTDKLIILHFGMKGKEPTGVIDLMPKDDVELPDEDILTIERISD